MDARAWRWFLQHDHVDSRDDRRVKSGTTMTLDGRFQGTAYPREDRLRAWPRPASLPDGEDRFPRIANVDRINGDNDNADFDFPKANVRQLFGGCGRQTIWPVYD